MLAKDIVVECGGSCISWIKIEALGRMIRFLGWQSLIAPSVSKAFGRAICDETIRIFLVKDLLRAEQERVVKQGSVHDQPTPPTVIPGMSSFQ